MEYLAPTSKDNPISFALPQINNALDALQTAGSILTALNEGSHTSHLGNTFNEAY